jgi:predicted ribonuclease YlaK
MTAALPDSMAGNLADNSILSIVLTLVKQLPDTDVILVSKYYVPENEIRRLDHASRHWYPEQIISFVH